MDISEYLVIVFLTVLLLYGLGNFIAAPILIRRFYREVDFLDQGHSALESPADSLLLQPLATSHLYRGQHSGYDVEQCMAFLQSRRQFTLSKARRKLNQARWSVTRSSSEQVLPSFCLLPIADVSTALQMLNDSGVDLSEDEAFAHRYYLKCENPEKLKALIFGDLRDFLLQREMISIECIDNTVLIKRNWPVEKLKARLLDDLNASTTLVRQLSNDEGA